MIPPNISNDRTMLTIRTASRNLPGVLVRLAMSKADKLAEPR
jgi:hypothetical protein